jgi:hypothetical protein
MADDDDVDLGDVVDSLDRMNKTQNLLGLLGAASAIQRSREAREMNARLSGLQQAEQARQQAEQARQQAEAARAEQEYLGAHCPWCHTSLAGTPAVCAACTRAIVWCRLPLNEAVVKLMASNLHAFKELYRERLGASVLFDQNQKLVHVPLSSQQEVAQCTRSIVWCRLPLDAALVELMSSNLGTFNEVYRELLGAPVWFDLNQKLVHVPLSSQQDVAEAQKRLHPLNCKLNAYIDFFCRVVDRRETVVATCPKCQSEFFERALVSEKNGKHLVCQPCTLRDPDKLCKNLVAISTLIGFVGWIASVAVVRWLTKGGYDQYFEVGAVLVTAMWIVGINLYKGRCKYRASSQITAIATQKADLLRSAAIPVNSLTFDATSFDVLLKQLDTRTTQLEELLNRIDGAALPKRIAPESGDAGREFANVLDAVANGSSAPVIQPFKTPIRNVAVSQSAMMANAAEFTSVGKQKLLSAESPVIRAVALALVAMKTVDAAAVRACVDRLARKLIEITPDELTKSVRIVGAGVKEAKLQFVFEQLCDSLKAESEFMKSKHRAVAEVIAELLPKDGESVPGNANGPKVIRALCKVLKS